MHSTHNGSDKIYKMQLTGDDSTGWCVQIQHGRRMPGTDHDLRGTQTDRVPKTGTTTYATAYHEYTDKIYEKRTGKSHYQIISESSGGPVTAASLDERPVAILMESGPMLLIPIETEEEALRYCRNPSWMAQEKQDGERRLIKNNQGKITAINRKDEQTSLQPRIEQTAKNIGHNFLNDGEEVGDVQRAFDLLELDGENLRGNSAKSRWQALAKLVALCDGDGIRVCETAFTTADKLAMFARIKRDKGEGIVFKMSGASYEAGKSKKALKFKFKARQTFVAGAQNGLKRSVAILAPTSDDNSEMVAIGNVTIPSNHEIPGQGAFIEIEYLYAYPNGGSLFQPVYKGVRSDVGGEGGTKVSNITELKFRQGTVPVDEEDES
jgi:bifunctional non-homologous end joining protein LigD